MSTTPRGAGPGSDVRDACVSAAEFRTLFQELKTWGRWGPQDERGALHHLTPERVAAATRLVRDGISVTLSLPLNTELAIHNPKPADHYMTHVGDDDDGSGSLQFNKDYVGADYHHDGHTHIDALCHIVYDGSTYNGRPADSVTTEGATFNTIEVLKGVAVQAGDILLVRTGHARRLAELGPWNTAEAKAGLHPTAMTFIAQREVAALGSDGNSDTAPSSTEGVGFPIHVLAINAMGIHLLDYLQFEDLRVVCERTGRWDFLLVAAPLRIAGGTGSPLNPIAIF
jgi:kynurenine formamidase